MKICTVCSCEHDQPRSQNCVKCQRKINHKRYCDSHKEKRYEYMMRYIKNNPEKRKESSRRSYCKKKGISLSDLRTKRKQGEGHLKKNGYRVLNIKGHPNSCSKKGWIYEHVVVMSKNLNRPLTKGEAVHHKNGIKHDNRIENLELWSRSHPPGQRISDKIDWCIEFLNKYLDDEIFRGQIINWVKSKR